MCAHSVLSIMWVHVQLAAKIVLAHKHLRTKYVTWQQKIVQRARGLATKIKVYTIIRWKDP